MVNAFPSKSPDPQTVLAYAARELPELLDDEPKARGAFHPGTAARAHPAADVLLSRARHAQVDIEGGTGAAHGQERTGNPAPRAGGQDRLQIACARREELAEELPGSWRPVEVASREVDLDGANAGGPRQIFEEPSLHDGVRERVAEGV